MFTLAMFALSICTSSFLLIVRLAIVFRWERFAKPVYGDLLAQYHHHIGHAGPIRQAAQFRAQRLHQFRELQIILRGKLFQQRLQMLLIEVALLQLSNQ